MATYKNTSGDYVITCENGAGTLTINADLDVVGNITYIESTDLKIEDAFITVAANNNGTTTSMGMVAQKTNSGAGTFAGLRFNSITNEWEISPSVDADGGPISPYSAISTSAGTLPGLPNTSVQFNVANVFTGSSNFLFDSSASKLTLSGHLALGNIGSTPTLTSNAATLYNKAEGSGGTGVYVKSSTVDDELVSKSKAIVFSIIF